MSRQIESLRRFVSGARDGTSPGSENVVVFASGKGGVGTSTMAALMAVGLSRRGERVLLIDGSQGWLHMLFGISETRGLAAVRSGHATPRELLIQIREGLDLLPSSLGDESLLLDAGPMERRALARKLGELYPAYTAVLVDAGSRLASVLEACELGANRLVTVTTGERLAVAAAYGLMKGVRQRYPALPRDVLINREDDQSARPVWHCIEEASQRFESGAIRHLGTVPIDGRLIVGLEPTRPIQHTPPEAPAAQATLEIAARLQADLNRPAASRSGDRLASRNDK